MLDRSAFVFEAESSSLRVILELSDVIAVKYDARLIVRFHHPCNSLDIGILGIDDLHALTFLIH